MLIDSIIVGIVVTAAVAYLVWMMIPRRRSARTAAPCGACARSPELKQAVPVRTRWTG